MVPPPDAIDREVDTFVSNEMLERLIKSMLMTLYLRFINIMHAVNSVTVGKVQLHSPKFFVINVTYKTENTNIVMYVLVHWNDFNIINLSHITSGFTM